MTEVPQQTLMAVRACWTAKCNGKASCQKRGKGPVQVGSTQLGGPALPELWQYSEATLNELRGLQATVDGGEQEVREEDTEVHSRAAEVMAELRNARIHDGPLACSITSDGAGVEVAVHVVLALAFWIWPAAHSWQYAAASWFTAPEPKRPGSHASQKNAFLCSLCLPAGHTSHLSAFSFAEYCPAAHSLHRLPLTKVPGLQMPQ